ncbi:hypothetical protein NEIFLAOT_00307 [Neisseria flavescens NRL30031/H210]|uniref:Uncharacterized protein n=1 Tax=Neisseria flavescens NRL30031/H210 TaxID=546264 RepID=C0EK65_NEIFL|nr:hypothetical protein NEIFLAOT_00307 [Neisseria flavescens NRL30031/H210]
MPEVRQQVRVRVRRQAFTVNFLTEVVQLVFGQAAFDKGAGIDARGGVSLEKDQIAFFAFAFGFPEVVEADFVHGGGRLERCDVPTQLQIFLAGAQYDGGGVPAHECADAVFDVLVARDAFFVFNGNGVQVWSSGAVRHTDAFITAVFDQTFQQVLGALAAFIF